MCKKDYMWNPVICSCENGEYLESIIDDSAVTFDEIVDSLCIRFDKVDGFIRVYDETRYLVLFVSFK